MKSTGRHITALVPFSEWSHLGKRIIRFDNDNSWRILWTNEVHFNLTGYVNSESCLSCDDENPQNVTPTPIQKLKWLYDAASQTHSLSVRTFQRSLLPQV